MSVDDYHGAIRQPITADNSTVLGYRVKPDSVQWLGLDWTKVRTDEGPHALHPDTSGYLHVGFCHPQDKPNLWGGVQYRVRYIKETGAKMKSPAGKPVQITSIWAEQRGDGGWEWVIGYGPRAKKKEVNSGR